MKVEIDTTTYELDELTIDISMIAHMSTALNTSGVGSITLSPPMKDCIRRAFKARLKEIDNEIIERNENET